MSAQLQRVYRGHDPSMPPPLGPSGSADATSTARHFSVQLHQVAESAGFRLCDRVDEQHALQGHFGDEHVWNVPVRARA